MGEELGKSCSSLPSDIRSLFKVKATQPKSACCFKGKAVLSRRQSKARSFARYSLDCFAPRQPSNDKSTHRIKGWRSRKYVS
ncbi:hypothetical protein ACO22_02009 [Paracoccidioides brasiliensis]|uniref:Uncharacterized protein n=1 Tax=Paracoccidioides brasiliensis TaxID=121759 RepID=A0A1D2JK98_PARBR|nr:hypothetical protein ACO22_02009 [Paracoccidioides brasiliensis]ODH53193.1 hypothetical protein GX48_00729 [Paracoccidioides brasiliensis]